MTVTHATGVTPVDGLPLAQRRWVMGCIMLGMVLSSLDSSIANIALPSIAHSLLTSDAAVVLVVNGYQLAATICLLPIAALSESQGFKRVYAPGMAIFTLASLCCALSPTLHLLVASRVVQGAGGACMSVAGMAIVRSIYPRNIVSRGFALIALSVAIAAALGPTVAAFILAVAHWPWLFLVNVPLGLCALPIFIRLAPASIRQSRPFDFIGAVLNALAFEFVVVGIGSLGIDESRIAIGEIVLGGSFFAIFAIQQSKRPVPLLPLDLIRIPVFALSVGTSTCSYAAQILCVCKSALFVRAQLRHGTGADRSLFDALAAAGGFCSAHRRPAGQPLSGIGRHHPWHDATGHRPAPPRHLAIDARQARHYLAHGAVRNRIRSVSDAEQYCDDMSGPPERSGAAAGMNAVARYVGWSLGSAVVALIFGVVNDGATIDCLKTGAIFAAVGAILSGARWRPVGGQRTAGSD